jgi:hypothetical protein
MPKLYTYFHKEGGGGDRNRTSCRAGLSPLLGNLLLGIYLFIYECSLFSSLGAPIATIYSEERQE